MKLLKSITLFAILAYLSGCAMSDVNHYCGVALGTSVSALEKEKVRYSKVFDKDVPYCYAKTLEALKKWDAHAFIAKKGQYIVATRLNKVFNSCGDTTETGIFFKETGPNKTQIEVVSLNYYLGAFVAENLFKYIENPEAPTCPLIKEKQFKI